MEDSKDIAKRSKSNLAFALSSLPRQRRDDMVTFYAFCRVVDDIADEPGMETIERHRQLDVWRASAAEGFDPANGKLHADLAEIVDRYSVPPEQFVQIIDGVSCDIEPTLYQTYDELLAYCYKVASVVGLVSVRVFGCESESASDYATSLGYALQITNIMRDVGEDLNNGGRIYLPLETMAQFGYSEDDLRQRRYNSAFKDMMSHHYERAVGYYEEAAKLLPSGDKKRLVASEMMAKIYREILEAMRADDYRVFDKRYGLSKARKATILATSWLKAKLG